MAEQLRLFEGDPLTEAIGAELAAAMRALGEAYAASMLRVLTARDACESVCAKALANEVSEWRSRHFEYMERDMSSWPAYEADCRRIRAMERGEEVDDDDDWWDDEDDVELSELDIAAREGISPAECFGEFDPEQDLPDGVYEELCERAAVVIAKAKRKFAAFEGREHRRFLRKRNALLRRLQQA